MLVIVCYLQFNSLFRGTIVKTKRYFNFNSTIIQNVILASADLSSIWVQCLKLISVFLSNQKVVHSQHIGCSWPWQSVRMPWPKENYHGALLELIYLTLSKEIASKLYQIRSLMENTNILSGINKTVTWFKYCRIIRYSIHLSGIIYNI